MTQQSRPTFEILMGEVSLKAPETPLYIRLAGQVLEARLLEMEDGAPPDPSPPSSTPVVATAAAPTPASAATEAAPAPETPALDEQQVGAVEIFEPQGAVPAAEAAGPAEAPLFEPLPAAVVESQAPAPTTPPQALNAQPAAAPPPSPEQPPGPVRRARWFRGQFPVVTFEDGSSRVMESLEALKELLRSRGLQPHPRGDASMLLWQVRTRLGLAVSQVDA